MELINFLPEVFFTMATVFAGMGTATQSGKLKLKRLIEGNCISFIEDERGVTISTSAIPGSAPTLPQNAVGYGDGTDIKSGFLYTSETAGLKGFVGLQTIRQRPESCFASCVYNSPYSLIVGGCNNQILQSCKSVIVGGYDNRMSYSSNNSNIISSEKGLIYCSENSLILSGKGELNCKPSQSNASLIASCGSSIRSSDRSSIISSGSSYISGKTSLVGYYYYQQLDQSIIGSKNSRIMTYGCLAPSQVFGKNTIISSLDSKIISCVGQTYKNTFVSESSIIASRNSVVTNLYIDYNDGVPNKSSHILASSNATASHTNSIIISSCDIKIQRNYIASNDYIGAGIVIGSENIITTAICNSAILFSKNSSFNRFGSIISSECSCQATKGTKNPNTIIASYKSCILLGGTIIASGCSCICSSDNYKIVIGSCCSETLLAGQKNIVAVGLSSSLYSNFVIGGSYHINGSSGVGIIGGLKNSTSLCGCSGTSTILKYNTGCLNFSNYAVGGSYNIIFNTQFSIINSVRGRMYNTKESIILGGGGNRICGYGPNFEYSSPPHSCDISVKNSFIISGGSNSILGATDSSACLKFQGRAHHVYNSGVIGGCGNAIRQTTCLGKFVAMTSSVIIGGACTYLCKSYTMGVENILIKGPGGGVYTYDSLGTKCTGFSGTKTTPTQICVVNGLVTSVT